MALSLAVLMLMFFALAVVGLVDVIRMLTKWIMDYWRA